MIAYQLALLPDILLFEIEGFFFFNLKSLLANILSLNLLYILCFSI